MNRKQTLAQARKILADNHVEDASLEGEILLRHVLGIDRSQLFAELDKDINSLDFDKLVKLVERRVKAPLAVRTYTNGETDEGYL